MDWMAMAASLTIAAVLLFDSPRGFQFVVDVLWRRLVHVGLPS
jgi:hypothetical protein